MKYLRRKRNRESGQAAIEFIVVVIVIFFFLFFFLSLSFALVISDYVEYATFMAARTYKSGYSSEEFQRRYAQQTFDGYTSRIDGIARNFELEFIQADGSDEQTSGVRSTYELDLFYLPPLFIVNGDTPVSSIVLNSEALLGRDPAFEDCTSFFDNFANQFGLGIGGSVLVEQMADNGC